MNVPKIAREEVVPLIKVDISSVCDARPAFISIYRDALQS